MPVKNCGISSISAILCLYIYIKHMLKYTYIYAHVCTCVKYWLKLHIDSYISNKIPHYLQ